MGTIGTYHYDDRDCQIAVTATAVLRAHLRNEVLAQGPAFLDHYLDTLRDLVLDDLHATGGRGVELSAALGARRARSPVDDPRR